MLKPAYDADAIMTVCHQWHDNLAARRVLSEKCIMVPNGVDTELFSPATQERKVKVRRRLGIPENSVCVGFSAKRSSDSSNRKGIETLVNAMQSLGGYPGISFAIMGPGWHDLVREQVQRGINCVYMPFLFDRGDVAEFYKAIDVFWVTSRIEGGPVPLLEAMSSGVPCISTAVGVAIDAITDNTNGFIAPFDYPDFYVSTTKQLTQMPDKLKRFGEAARDTVTSQFNEAKTTQSVASLYEIAERNFERRGGRLNAPRSGWSKPPVLPHNRPLMNASFPHDIRGWAMAEEHLVFFDYLMSEGDRVSAARVGLRAILSNPFSPRVWRRVLSVWPTVHRLLRYGYTVLKEITLVKRS